MMRAALLLLGLVSLGFAQSPFNISNPWGSEISSGDPSMRGTADAGLARRSTIFYDPRLPARSVTNTATSFNIQFLSELMYIEDEQTSNRVGGSEVPIISLCIPMKRWGTLGAAYWQRFDRDFDYSASAEADSFRISSHSEGGPFEGVITYAVRIPGARWLAAGLAYHRLLGQQRIIQSTIYQAVSEPNPYILEDTLLTRREGGYWAVSAWGSHGAFDFGGFLDFSSTVDAHHDKRRTDFDRTLDTTWSEEVSTPLAMGAALAWRATGRQTIAGDVRWKDWTYVDPSAEPEWFMGLGWEFAGTGDRFDPYLRRVAWRAGSRLTLGGVEDRREYAATLGAGLPLGGQGSLDIGFELGKKSSEKLASPMDEVFTRLYVSLTGANSWGNSSRRR